ncbi:glyceraldehyde-3-phosphate dehydrogenase [Pseudokineococcus sp. 1T1Z-3]|uniref:glyceraldehyde-3-phosphate dehydrogenase n=1 Tax=Pseudokineococcus sp. 1T1Z-3 TaxID=3132745 RepID=UPI00309EDBA3
MPTESHQRSLDAWSRSLSVAEELVPLVGRLHREHGVVLSVHGRGLAGLSPVGLVKAHRFARHADGDELPLDDTHALLRVLMDLDLAPGSVDVGKVLAEHRAQGGDLEAMVRRRLGDRVGGGAGERRPPRDVVVYGFGRIGRLVTRILVEHAGPAASLRLRAVVVRPGGPEDLTKRASLLRRDSVHGPFRGTITVDHEAQTILANGTLIQVLHASDPAAVDYPAHDIDDALVVDTTGRWRDAEGLSQHLRSPGVARVLLTAPGKGDLPNVVAGINMADVGDHPVVTAASCTTNAITPVLHVLQERFGVEHGHLETVHSFTNDQNLIDNYHRGARRGRAATLNMVIAETGAAKAVAKALPALAGRLTGSAIRVPTPDVSLAVLALRLERPTTVEELNDLLRRTSLHGPLRRQVGYISSPEVVSTDFLGSQQAGVVDGLATLADGRDVVLYVWYDNEYGYSHQVVRVLEEMARPTTTAPSGADPEPVREPDLAGTSA